MRRKIERKRGGEGGQKEMDGDRQWDVGVGKDRNMVGEKDQTKEISRNMRAHTHTRTETHYWVMVDYTH